MIGRFIIIVLLLIAVHHLHNIDRMMRQQCERGAPPPVTRPLT